MMELGMFESIVRGAEMYLAAEKVCDLVQNPAELPTNAAQIIVALKPIVLGALALHNSGFQPFEHVANLGYKIVGLFAELLPGEGKDGKMLPMALLDPTQQGVTDALCSLQRFQKGLFIDDKQAKEAMVVVCSDLELVIERLESMKPEGGVDVDVVQEVTSRDHFSQWRAAWAVLKCPPNIARSAETSERNLISFHDRDPERFRGTHKAALRAGWKGDWLAVAEELRKDAANADAQGNHFHMLHQAVFWSNQFGTAQLLLYGADINVGTLKEDELHFPKDTTPLHLAAALGDDKMCRLLLWWGADRLKKDAKGHTAADVAASVLLRELLQANTNYDPLVAWKPLKDAMQALLDDGGEQFKEAIRTERQQLVQKGIPPPLLNVPVTKKGSSFLHDVVRLNDVKFYQDVVGSMGAWAYMFNKEGRLPSEMDGLGIEMQAAAREAEGKAHAVLELCYPGSPC